MFVTTKLHLNGKIVTSVFFDKQIALTFLESLEYYIDNCTKTERDCITLKSVQQRIGQCLCTSGLLVGSHYKIGPYLGQNYTNFERFWADCWVFLHPLM